MERLSGQHLAVLAMFLGFSCPIAVQKSEATPPDIRLTSAACDEFNQVLHVSTANDKCWDEKTWVRYNATCYYLTL